GNIKQIIVRWEIQDLCLGVSDLELYDYCIENKITLFRNTRIHLKAFWNNSKSILMGSANVTGKGIGEVGDFNFELNGIINDITLKDQSYLNRIILESEYVTEKLFEIIKATVKKVDMPTVNFPKLPTPPP